MPISRIARAVCSGSIAIRTPIASSRSALPHWLEIDRLPCLATRTPAPATTNAATVEILKVPLRSPPVPQVSSSGAPFNPTFTGTAIARMARANPASSSTVSPFIRKRRQECRNLRVAGLAAENGVHGRFRLRRRQVFALHNPLDVEQKRHDIVKFLLA